MVYYNMMVSALQLSKLPVSTEISLFREEISLWIFLLLSIPPTQNIEGQNS